MVTIWSFSCMQWRQTASLTSYRLSSPTIRIFTAGRSDSYWWNVALCVRYSIFRLMRTIWRWVNRDIKPLYTYYQSLIFIVLTILSRWLWTEQRDFTRTMGLTYSSLFGRIGFPTFGLIRSNSIEIDRINNIWDRSRTTS